MTDENDMVFPDPARGAQQSYDNQAPMGLETGLTKREYFAAKAMQGILTMFSASGNDKEALSSMAVEMADALIIALNKNNQ